MSSGSKTCDDPRGLPLSQAECAIDVTSTTAARYRAQARFLCRPSKLSMVRGLAASDHLDMVRGVAALLVVFGHARVLFLQSAGAGVELSVVSKCLYLLSGLGHQAVIVFFVLSGFFISSSVMRDIEQRNWSWTRYLTNRGTRLYVVLLPCLFLTVFWDRLGNLLIDPAQLASSDTGTANISREVIEANTTLASFMGNLFFLQTVLVPTYGSNAPLWSLSNEFWYYVLFPCVLLALIPARSWHQRLGMAVLSACVLCFVGRSIAIYFSIWLLGTLLCVLPPLPILAARRNTLVGLACCSVFLFVVLLAVVLRRIAAGVFVDVVTAGVFCGWMVCILHLRNASRTNLYSRVAHQLSGFSFSLYALHMPVLIFFRELLTRHSGWKAGLTGWLALLAILLVVCAYAYVVAWFTERHTNQIRRWLERGFLRA